MNRRVMSVPVFYRLQDTLYVHDGFEDNIGARRGQVLLHPRVFGMFPGLLGARTLLCSSAGTIRLHLLAMQDLPKCWNRKFKFDK